jgi:DNA-binding transcriptional ArsR family regulator
MVEYNDVQLTLTYMALADPTRRAILSRLRSGASRITELAAPFAMSLNAVSKHIRILERAGLVQRQVRGRDHYIALQAAPLRDASAWIDTYRTFWEERLDALETFLHLQKQAQGPPP